jgi:putative nucleotidyltransferase with HDIG domain
LDKSFLTWLHETRLADERIIDWIQKLSLFIIVAIVAGYLFPSGKSLEYGEYQIGSVVNKEIIAPFDFPILKTPEELRKERREAVALVEPVYDYDAEVVVNQLKRLDEFNGFYEALAAGLKNQEPNVWQFIRSQKSIDSLYNKLSLGYIDSMQVVVKNNFRLNLSKAQHTAFIYFAVTGNLTPFMKKFRQILKNQVYGRGILDVPVDSLGGQDVILRRGGISVKKKRNALWDLSGAKTLMLERLEARYKKQPELMALGRVLTNSFIIPNWQFSITFTDQLKKEAIAAVPISRGFVYKNERIIDSHDLVTEEKFRKLQSLAAEIDEQSFNTRFWDSFLASLGKFILSILLMLALATYLFVFHYDLIWSSFSKLLLINLIMIMLIVVNWLFIHFFSWPPLLMPFVLAPMLFAILLNGPIALMGATVLAAITASINGFDFSFFLVHLMASISVVYSVRKIRKRIQVVTSVMILLGVYALLVIAIGLIKFQSLNTVSESLLFIFANSLFTPLLAYGILGFFERLFDITTDFTLLELSDMNHPLLKKLSIEASGTFSHSIEVGNLAESAAKAIGANSLLTRVGCYYHDIGKLDKTEYFVENQLAGSNRHDQLSPNMSALVITAHVKKGIEMAKKYRLPAVIRAFIPEHHGTTPVEYFYHKAKENNKDTEVDIDDFRYPGPKPQSRETAIVMLADTIEAAGRTLKDPSPSRIRQVIDTLVQKKIDQGQLDESNITLKELSKVKAAFEFYLTSKFHVRIEYPEDASKNGSTATKKEAKAENG